MIDKWKQPAGGERIKCASCNGTGDTKHTPPRYCPSCMGKGHNVTQPATQGMEAMKTLFNEYGHYTGKAFPKKCVKECSASGQCFPAVNAWRKKLDFTVPRDMAINWLASTGAWPRVTDEYDTGLNDTNDETLAERVLWLACCDIRDNGEWFGLTE